MKQRGRQNKPPDEKHWRLEILMRLTLEKEGG